MPAPPLTSLVRLLAPERESAPDGQLLDRFARDGDQSAFELLVWRHGGLVWAACRRLLGPDLDSAQDACQAAFVALALRAGTLRDGQCVAAWLHRVAVRASLDLLATRRRAGPLPDRLADPRAHEPGQALAEREAGAALDAAIDRLADTLRAPFVLCELEGRSNAEAAALLGCPVGTIESRLSRARQRLRRWLGARGLEPLAATPPALLHAPTRALLLAGAGPFSADPGVRALAVRAAGGPLGVKFRLALVGIALLTAGIAGLTLTAAGPPSRAQPAGPVPAAPPQARPAAADADPLPPRAVARLGSPRLRHGGWVHGLVYSGDGARLASCSDHSVRVWDGTTGKQLFLASRTGGAFRQVAFADGGKLLMAVGDDGSGQADLWHLDRQGKVLARLPVLAPERVPLRTPLPDGRAVRFSPDGSRLALGLADVPRLLVVDAHTGRSEWEARFPPGAPQGAPGGVAFSPDGREVAVSSHGTTRFFTARGEPAGEVGWGRSRVTTLALSPDGRLVLAREEGPALLTARDRATGRIRWQRQHAGEYGLLFTPDGKTVLQSSGAGAAYALDPANGEAGGQKFKTFRAMVGAISAAVRPDGKVVAFGTRSGAIALYEVASGKLTEPSADPPHAVERVHFSPDGKTLYGWAADWVAWDVATGEQRPVTREGWNYGAPLSPDGRRTARITWFSGLQAPGGPDHSHALEIVEVGTGKVVASHRGPHGPNRWIDFTPAGTELVLAGLDGRLQVLDAATGKRRAVLEGHTTPPSYRAFSGDGRLLATASLADPSEEYPVRVWDLKMGKLAGKFAPGVKVTAVALSGDGRRVAASAYLNTAGKPDPRQRTVVWDVVTGRQLASLPQLGDAGHLALSPDGHTVALASRWSSEVRVFEVTSGGERFRFGQGGTVSGVAFRPGGATLAVASEEAPVLLWDVGGGKDTLPSWDAASIWADLAGEPARGFQAIRRLRAEPGRALGLLRERTRLAPGPDEVGWKRLLADLDAEDRATRERASATLAGHGETVRARLDAALADSPPAEVKRRLAQLRDALDARTPDRARRGRAAEAVGAMAGSGATDLLREWARGTSGALLAEEAQAALARRAPAREP